MKPSAFRLTLRYLLGIHIAALVVFSLFRVVQYVALHGMIQPATEASHLTAFVKGLWFDNVIACYVMALPYVALLLSAAVGYAPRWMRRATAIWCGILFSLAFMASAANIPYFTYFFKNIDHSIFGWFGYVGTTAGMVFQESSYWLYIGLYFVVVALFVVFLRRWRRRTDRRIAALAAQPRLWGMVALRLVAAVAVGALCFFGIRGRTGYNPIKISQAYYCDDPFLNQLGINPAFNLLTSTLDGLRAENAELHLMDNRAAVDDMRRRLNISGEVSDSTRVLLRHVVAEGEPRTPNIVMILMESMSADLLQTFGQREPLTPTLDSLYQHALAFTHFYSAGIHTNHGITATLYSYPALMFRNLMKGTVTPRREGLPTVLHQQGYHNMFFMTHEAQYDNMNAFLRTNAYDEVFAQEDYPEEERVNAFGVPDKYLFDYALPVINERAKSEKPFFATILTISNHPPYIIPEWFKPRTTDKETQIVEYADWCIGQFLSEARRQPWFDHTLFVVLADHGKLVGQSEAELPQSLNHIPLLIFGEGITPMVYDGLAMQVDVMPTLLGMLNMSYDYDGFGIDLMRSRRQQVCYTSDTQIVGRDSSACFIYNPKADQEFFYQVSPQGQLTPTTPSAQLDSLRHAAFSMVQTAEFLYRRSNINSPRREPIK